jgi:pimeloyl-ACP methyl ester carboxylesterase
MRRSREIQRWQIEIPQAALDDLRDRLQRVRWPAEVAGVGASAGWVRGVPVGYLRSLADYWLHDYDWRAHEAELNQIPQFVTTIDGQRIHFLHVRSPHASALPLVITHGWPGSFVEMLKLIEPLTNPDSGDPADAFHVVVPSIPGFGFSTPLQAGWHDRRIARAWHKLMLRLGYSWYGAHGGDSGSIVSPELGRIAPEHVVGVHIYANLDPPSLTAEEYAALTPAEQARLEATRALLATGSGYGEIQATKPQTLAYALNDSPAGQLAWIVEKFKEWTDPACELPEDAVDRDQLLTNVSLYWLTGTGATSAQLYYESRADPAGSLVRSSVPTGIAVFPYDPAIRGWLDRLHTIVHWSEFDRGGHFAAMEVPDLLVGDLRAFYRKLR